MINACLRYLFFICTCFNSTWGQTVLPKTIEKNGKTYFIYPEKYNLQDRNDLFSQLKSEIKLDSISPSTYQIRNKKNHFKQKYLSIVSNQYYNLETYSIQPALDSLPDGNYVMFHQSFPLLIEDEIYLSDTCIAAKFSIANNELNGQFEYSDPNRTMTIKGNYLNDLRDGTWNFSIKNHYFNPKGDAFVFESSSIGDYKKNQKQGKHSINYGNNSYEYAHFTNDKLDGEYLKINNKDTVLSGHFKSGKPNGKWLAREFSYDNNQLINATECTFNDHLIIPVDKVIITSKFCKLQQKSDMWLIGNAISSVYSNGFSSFYTNEKFDDSRLKNLTSIGDILNYPVIEFHGKKLPTEDSIIRPFEFINFDFIDSNNTPIKEEDYIRKSGLFLDYINTYKEYHKNGQLRLAIDCSSWDGLHNFTTYYPDGKIEYQIAVIDSIIEQKWIDSTGKLYIHSHTSLDGKKESFIVDPYYLKKNGKNYYNNLNQWIWENNSSLSKRDTSEILLVECLNLRDSLTLKQLKYTPATRKGVLKEKFFDSFLERRCSIELNEDYSSVTMHDTLIYGPLKRIESTTFALDSLNYFEYYKQFAKDSTINLSFLRFAFSNELLKHDSLFLNNNYYNGKITMIYKTLKTRKNFYLKTNNNLKIVFNVSKNSSPYNATSFFKIDHLIPHKNFTSIWYESNEWGKKTKRIFENHYSLKKVTIPIENGMINGQVDYFSKRNKIAQINYQENKQNGSFYSYNYFTNKTRTLDQKQLRKHFLFENGIFKNDTLIGNYIQYDQEKDTVIYGVYKNNVLTGNPLLLSKNQTEKVYEYYTNDLLDSTFILSNTAQFPQMKMNFKTGNGVSYTHDRKVFQTCKSVNDSLVVTQFTSKLGQYYEMTIFKKQLIRQCQFVDDVLVEQIEFHPNDTLDYSSYNNKFDLIDQNIQYTWSRNSKKTSVFNPTGNAYYYDRLGKIIREGQLDYGEKVGKWNIHYSKDTIYQLTFDTIEDKSNRMISFYYWYINSGSCLKIVNNKDTLAKGTFSEYQSEFDCSDAAYFDLFLFSPIQKDTLIAVKHYFSNGQLMYEGKMKNGKADGVWKWYHHDGKLWGLGKYANGLKEGRWLYGDLEKIRYMADVCVQESTDIDELLKEIQVTKIIYEKGEIIDNGSFNYSMENNR